jgi:hypothetical protein
VLVAAAIIDVVAVVVRDDKDDVFEGVEELGSKLIKADTCCTRNEAGSHWCAELMESTDVEIQITGDLWLNTLEFINDDFLERNPECLSTPD